MHHNNTFITDSQYFILIISWRATATMDSQSPFGQIKNIYIFSHYIITIKRELWQQVEDWLHCTATVHHCQCLELQWPVVSMLCITHRQVQKRSDPFPESWWKDVSLSYLSGNTLFLHVVTGAGRSVGNKQPVAMYNARVFLCTEIKKTVVKPQNAPNVSKNTIQTIYSDLDVFTLDTRAASRVVLFSRHAKGDALLHQPRVRMRTKAKCQRSGLQNAHLARGMLSRTCEWQQCPLWRHKQLESRSARLRRRSMKGASEEAGGWNCHRQHRDKNVSH